MHWSGDMFTMMKDLRAEAPRIGRWGFVLNIPMWLGGLLYTVVTMPTSLFLDARNLVLYWRGEDRAFERSGAVKVGG